jgi:hypothetical protein
LILFAAMRNVDIEHLRHSGSFIATKHASSSFRSSTKMRVENMNHSNEKVAETAEHVDYTQDAAPTSDSTNKVDLAASTCSAQLTDH